MSDNESINYFMTKMTQEEFDEMRKKQIRSNDYETGWTREERYIMNKIRSKIIDKMEEELNNKPPVL